MVRSPWSSAPSSTRSTVEFLRNALFDGSNLIKCTISFAGWIDKDGEKLWASTYLRDERKVHEGQTVKINVKKSSTTITFSDGMSYEVEGHPKLKTGGVISIYKVDDTLLAR